VNKELNKGKVSEIVINCYRDLAMPRRKLLDDIKKIGFENATFRRISIGIDDLQVRLKNPKF